MKPMQETFVVVARSVPSVYFRVYLFCLQAENGRRKTRRMPRGKAPLEKGVSILHEHNYWLRSQPRFYPHEPRWWSCVVVWLVARCGVERCEKLLSSQSNGAKYSEWVCRQIRNQSYGRSRAHPKRSYMSKDVVSQAHIGGQLSMDKN